MKQHACWPWAFAYAGHSSRKNAYQSQWHHRRGAGFGVRRPLRYLAHRLDLDDSQMRRMASVLNQLKNEREQAQLDDKRSVTALAELLAEGTPTLEEVREVLAPRVSGAERLNDETARALIAISEFLDEDQRDEFINLMLTGAFTL